MSVIRIAFMGTPEFARYHLQQLLEDEHYQVVGVVSQPDRPSGRHMKLTPSPVKELALQKNIPVITPEKMSEQAAIDSILAWRPEVVVVVAFGQILSQRFLDLFPERVVNVHGSLLPRWRGAAPIQRAIMADDKETGVALQVMVKKLDAGAVIGSYALPITDAMDAISLHDALMPLGAKLLHVDLMDYLRGNIVPIQQDESQVTLAAKLDKAEGHIDWTKSARQIFCHIRGMVLGPGCYATIHGKKLKIWVTKVEQNEKDSGLKPGQVVHVEQGAMDVQCGTGVLRLLEVQPESKARMAVKDYLLGHPLQREDMFS